MTLVIALERRGIHSAFTQVSDPTSLTSHIRIEESHRIAVHWPGTIRRDKQRASALVALPTSDDESWPSDSTTMVGELLHSLIRPDVQFPSVARRIAASAGYFTTTCLAKPAQIVVARSNFVMERPSPVDEISCWMTHKRP